MTAVKLELKELDKFKYKDVLELLVKTPANSQQGIQVGEMRQLIKLLDKFDAANGSVLLTAEEHKLLKDRANSFPWGMVSREIIQFVDDLEGAKEWELQLVEG